MHEAVVELDMSVFARGKAETRVGLDVCEAGVGWSIIISFQRF